MPLWNYEKLSFTCILPYEQTKHILFCVHIVSFNIFFKYVTAFIIGLILKAQFCIPSLTKIWNWNGYVVQIDTKLIYMLFSTPTLYVPHAHLN